MLTLAHTEALLPQDAQPFLSVNPNIMENNLIYRKRKRLKSWLSTAVLMLVTMLVTILLMQQCEATVHYDYEQEYEEKLSATLASIKGDFDEYIKLSDAITTVMVNAAKASPPENIAENIIMSDMRQWTLDHQGDSLANWAQLQKNCIKSIVAYRDLFGKRCSSCETIEDPTECLVELATLREKMGGIKNRLIPLVGAKDDYVTEFTYEESDIKNWDKGNIKAYIRGLKTNHDTRAKNEIERLFIEINSILHQF